jgi:hypothetical protein
MYRFQLTYVLLVCMLMYAAGAYAQKDREELKKLSSDYEKQLKANPTFHLPYELNIASNLDTTSESVQVDLYKSENKDYLKMGRMQEVIHDGTLLMIVNHEMKMIRIGVDSANIGTNHLLVSNFGAIIDSSKSVKYTLKDGVMHYVLSFAPSFIYSSIELDFSKKTKNLYRVKAVFSDATPSEFKYIEVRYKDPDFKWVPAVGFPNTDKYVSKSNGRYVVQDAYDSYKLF